jgi:hypothetical protein
MPLLTELGNFIDSIFYKDVAPTALKNLRWIVSMELDDVWHLLRLNRSLMVAALFRAAPQLFFHPIE